MIRQKRRDPTVYEIDRRKAANNPDLWIKEQLEGFESKAALGALVHTVCQLRSEALAK